MSDDSDAFPNAEQLFRDAFALPDPIPELLNLIKEHPTYPAVVDMLVYYTFLTEENPSHADALTSTLLAVRDASDAPNINGVRLSEIFNRTLADLHRRGFEMDDDIESVVPTNTFLTTSLLSGLSFKYKLTECSDQYGNIVDGLDVDSEETSSKSEILVIGACIQLLSAGSEIVPSAQPYIQSANEVIIKLKVQQTSGMVKSANALQILKLTISHAETGFRKENDVANVWDILFPT